MPATLLGMRELYLLETGPDQQWMERAECALAAPEVFLPGDDMTAIAVCKRCPVRAECGEYADTNDERFGIWGGVRRG